jgi:hypothetical protein
LFIFFVVEEALLLRGDVDLVGEAVVVVVEEDAVSLGLARREVRVGGESEAGFLERDVGIRGGKDVRLW